MNRLFVSGGQGIGASASASVLLINIQDWSPFSPKDWIKLNWSFIFDGTHISVLWWKQSHLSQEPGPLVQKTFKFQEQKAQYSLEGCLDWWWGGLLLPPHLDFWMHVSYVLGLLNHGKAVAPKYMLHLEKQCPSPLLVSFFLSFFFFYYFLNWNIITFQCCVSFYCIISWISHMNTYILSLLSLPPTPSHSTHLGHQRAVSWAPCAYSSFPLASYLTHGSIYICQCHSQFILPSPSPSVSTSLFSISVLLFLPWK